MGHVYFKGMKTLVDFRLLEGDTCLASFTFKLNKLLSEVDNKKVRKIEFHDDWIDIDGRMKYNLIELKIDEDMKGKHITIC